MMGNFNLFPRAFSLSIHRQGEDPGDEFESEPAVPFIACSVMQCSFAPSLPLSGVPRDGHGNFSQLLICFDVSV